MGNIKPHLKALFPYKPIHGALVLRERPFVEPSGHQQLVAAKVDEGTDPKWTDELTPSDGSGVWHDFYDVPIRLRFQLISFK